jgi:hypothetical protein
MAWEILAPILGVAGIFLGSFLQKNREREKDRQDRRIDAYAKFLEIWAVSQRPDFNILMQRFLSSAALTDQEVQYYTFVKERFDHAHANLMIYGSKEVISALSQMYSFPDAELQADSKRAYIELLSAMRSDGFSDNYPEFASDVDNIMLDGPVERRQRMIQKHTQERLERDQ